MKLYFVFAIILILGGCTPTKVSIDKLQVKESRYYLKNEKPYTGEVVSSFDNGSIASIIQMKGGVPNGRWVAYGYKGEIVQEGNYQPVHISNEELFSNSNVVRLNVCNTKEGQIEFTDVYVVSKSIPDINLEQYKHQLLSFLKTKSVTVKGSSINEIKYVVAELGN
jgi:hypothetical protein